MSDQAIYSEPSADNISSSNKWATTGDLRYSSAKGLHSASDEDQHTKRVTFSTAVKVVLIPTISEYEEAQLCDAIWWEDGDFKSFKKSAIVELRMFMLQNPGLDAKKAVKILYQLPIDRTVDCTGTGDFETEAAESSSSPPLNGSGIPSAAVSSSVGKIASVYQTKFFEGMQEFAALLRGPQPCYVDNSITGGAYEAGGDDAESRPGGRSAAASASPAADNGTRTKVTDGDSGSNSNSNSNIGGGNNSSSKSMLTDILLGSGAVASSAPSAPSDHPQDKLTSGFGSQKSALISAATTAVAGGIRDDSTKRTSPVVDPIPAGSAEGLNTGKGARLDENFQPSNEEKSSAAAGCNRDEGAYRPVCESSSPMGSSPRGSRDRSRHRQGDINQFGGTATCGKDISVKFNSDGHRSSSGSGVTRAGMMSSHMHLLRTFRLLTHSDKTQSFDTAMSRGLGASTGASGAADTAAVGDSINSGVAEGTGSSVVGELDSGSGSDSDHVPINDTSTTNPDTEVRLPGLQASKTDLDLIHDRTSAEQINALLQSFLKRRSELRHGRGKKGKSTGGVGGATPQASAASIHPLALICS